MYVTSEILITVNFHVLFLSVIALSSLVGGSTKKNEAVRVSDTFLTTYCLNCTVTQKVKMCYIRTTRHGEANK